MSLSSQTIPVLSQECDQRPTVAAVIGTLKDRAYPAVLDSAENRLAGGRFTIVACDPVGELVCRPGDPDPFETSRRELAVFARATVIHPPHASAAARYFPGGWIGYLAYEAGGYIEQLPARPPPGLGLPLARFALYDTAAVHDARTGQWTVVAADLSACVPLDAGHPPPRERLQGWLDRLATAAEPAASPVPRSRLLRESLSPAEYMGCVRRAIEYIAAGDIFQVNLARRETWLSTEPPLETYLRLRQTNPGAYSAYLSWPTGPAGASADEAMAAYSSIKCNEPPDGQRRGSTTELPAAIMCSSPELFLRLRGRQVLTRPIKGTRPRLTDAGADAAEQAALAASPKDRAELAMIVDLERNDLGRVCEYGSIRVLPPPAGTASWPYHLESHATVHHLVADVVGRLAEGRDAIDLLRACFPGGSITGAPKVRAMEIIAELEPDERGPYTGSIGYFALHGDMTLNIAIRTLIRTGTQVHLYSGGGIVADSDPLAEYRETQAKALGLRRALGIDEPA